MGEPYKRFVQYSDIIYDPYISEKEFAFLEWGFNNFAKRKVKKVLDVACGTGRWTIPLRSKGYEVRGIDTSEDVLTVARSKANSKGVKIPFEMIDVREVNYRNSFDAAICMYDSLSYMLSDKDINASLKRMYESLRDGGVLIFDIGNRISLINRHNDFEIRHWEKDNIRIQATSKRRLDEINAVLLHDIFWVVDDNGKISTYRELYKFRIITYNEMRRLLEEIGFSEIKCFDEFTARTEVKDKATKLIFVAVKCSENKKD